jgi:hypothetical protein
VFSLWAPTEPTCLRFAATHSRNECYSEPNWSPATIQFLGRSIEMTAGGWRSTTRGGDSAVSTAKITVERRGQIVLIGINRPFINNRVDSETYNGLAKAYYQHDHDPSLRPAVAALAAIARSERPLANSWARSIAAQQKYCARSQWTTASRAPRDRREAANLSNLVNDS